MTTALFRYLGYGAYFASINATVTRVAVHGGELFVSYTRGLLPKSSLAELVRESGTVLVDG